MSVNISGNINAATGRTVNPTQVAQASAYFASQSAGQAIRNVQTTNGSTLYDVTMGRVGSAVRETPTVISGSPVVPNLDANFQLVRDFRPDYVVDAHSPDNGGLALQDAYTMAGTKMYGTNRDAYLAGQVSGPKSSSCGAAADNPINYNCPSMSLPGASAQNEQLRHVMETYNYRGLAGSSDLLNVGSGQSRSGLMSMNSAYTPVQLQSRGLSAPGLGYQSALGQTMTSAPSSGMMGIFSSPASALLSPASFARQGAGIP